MAFQLGNFVLAGELNNLKPHQTHGWLMIRGWEQPLLFELMGDPAPDLAGRRLYFEAKPRDLSAIEQLWEGELEADSRQFGAAGTMSAHHLVRAFDGDLDEFRRRSAEGEQPPTEWKRCLYLEWFGNDGHVVLELVDPRMYFIETREGKEVRVDLEPPEAPPFDPHLPPEGQAEARLVGAEGGGAFSAKSDFADDRVGTDEDGFDLFSEDLSQYLTESFGPPVQPQLSAEKSEDALWAELELMDDLIERGGGMEMGEIIGRTPDWRLLSEEKAERLLKILVARLATYRIAFDVCEHCDMRQAYRILVEELSREAHVHPELRGTDWVTHYSTSETCEACAAEYEADFGSEE